MRYKKHAITDQSELDKGLNTAELGTYELVSDAKIATFKQNSLATLVQMTEKFK